MKTSIEADRIGYLDESVASRIKGYLRDGYHQFQQHAKKGILLYGNVGVGKSTIAHALSGRKLKVLVHEETNELVIDAAEPLADIRIEHTASEIKVLSKCHDADLVIWEFPALDKSKAEEEIAGTFYIRKLFETMEQLKFVLIVCGSDLTRKKGCGFIETLSNFISMFKDVTCLYGSVSLVVTKISERKNIHHIQKAIEEILACNRSVSDAHKALIEKLSGIHLFHEPSEEDVKTTDFIGLYNFLESMDSLGVFSVVNKEMVATSISKIGISSHLLNMSYLNFHHVLDVLNQVISNPSSCLNTDSNMFSAYHSLIETWVPLSLCYKDHKGAETEYFSELELLTKLLHVIPNYEVSNISEALTVFQQVLEIFSEYSDPSNCFCIQDYAYYLQQQHEYVEFFSTVCEVEPPNHGKVIELLKVCHEKAQENLDVAVFNMHIDKNIANEEYYFRAITFLASYQQIPVCMKKMATVYWYLGGVTRQKDKFSASMHYLRSVKMYTIAMLKSFRQRLCYCQKNYGDI